METKIQAEPTMSNQLSLIRKAARANLASFIARRNIADRRASKKSTPEKMNGNTYAVTFSKALCAAIEEGKLIQGHMFQVDCYCKLNEHGLVLMQYGRSNKNDRVVPMNANIINQMYRIMNDESEL